MSRLERIVEQALVQAPAVHVAQVILPETLVLDQHELLELAVGIDQYFRRRRLERDAALDAEHGVAEVDAAADAERTRRRGSRRSISATGSSGRRRRGDGTPCSKPIVWRVARPCAVASNASRGQHPCLDRAACPPSVSLPPIVTPHRPWLTEYLPPAAGTGKPCSASHLRCSSRLGARSRTGARIFEPGAIVAQRRLEAHLVVAGRGAAVRDDVEAALERLAREDLGLQAALGADPQRVQRRRGARCRRSASARRARRARPARRRSGARPHRARSHAPRCPCAPARSSRRSRRPES